MDEIEGISRSGIRGFNGYWGMFASGGAGGVLPGWCAKSRLNVLSVLGALWTLFPPPMGYDNEDATTTQGASTDFSTACYGAHRWHTPRLALYTAY
jgi:hypothetical protein